MWVELVTLNKVKEQSISLVAQGLKLKLLVQAQVVAHQVVQAILVQ